MRILDENGIEIVSLDLEKGYLKEESLFVMHHEAIEAVEEVWHYETIAEYPNGGKDVAKVIDVQGVEAQEAWDEYEDILRYILYTEEELAERKRAKIPVAPRNITAGEYINIGGALYKATTNIPNGGLVITGQNAVATTIESQLNELAKGE